MTVTVELRLEIHECIAGAKLKRCDARILQGLEHNDALQTCHWLWVMQTVTVKEPESGSSSELWHVMAFVRCNAGDCVAFVKMCITWDRSCWTCPALSVRDLATRVRTGQEIYKRKFSDCQTHSLACGFKSRNSLFVCCVCRYVICQTSPLSALQIAPPWQQFAIKT